MELYSFRLIREGKGQELLDDPIVQEAYLGVKRSKATV
jgi:ABC-type branched-subunit amino acid transport system ATPase component